MTNKNIIISILKSISLITSEFGLISAYKKTDGNKYDIDVLLEDYTIKKGILNHNADYIWHFDKGSDNGIDSSFIKDNADVILISNKADENRHNTICYLLKLNS